MQMIEQQYWLFLLHALKNKGTDARTSSLLILTCIVVTGYLLQVEALPLNCPPLRYTPKMNTELRT